MKTTLFLTLLSALPALAGTSEVTTQYTPPAQMQDTWSWFAGGTGGYLLELEEDMYTFQLGAKSPWSVAGWSVALFAEVGWTENHDVEHEFDIVPLTFNVKLEKALSGGLALYAGGGVGTSYVDEIDYNSDDDWIFSAQVFAGLAYHVSESFEIFGGARWIYFDDPSFDSVELGDDWLIEGGIRFHF